MISVLVRLPSGCYVRLGELFTNYSPYSVGVETVETEE